MLSVLQNGCIADTVYLADMAMKILRPPIDLYLRSQPIVFFRHTGVGHLGMHLRICVKVQAHYAAYHSYLGKEIIWDDKSSIEDV